MNEITIQVHADRKLSKKVVDIGNMQESGVTKLIFELDEDLVALGGNVYLITSYDGESHPHVLKDNSLEVDRSFTQRKKTETNIVVSTSEDTENPLDGVVWISNTLMLTVDKNSINIDSINEEELPPSLKIIYDDLLNLQKDLQEKKDNDYWRGPQGPKGDAGSVKFVVVKELPTENIEENVMYLLQVDSEEENNKFLEYIYVDGAWENVGSASVEVDLTDYVKNTDYATTTGKAGVVTLNKDKGIFRANLSPVLEIVGATKEEIDRKNSAYKPIVTNVLDYAVMCALTNPLKHEWTDEEKASALERLGGVKKTDTPNQIYGSSTTYDTSVLPVKYGIPRYNINLTLTSETPTTDKEVANKKYVDQLVSQHDIINSESGEVVTTTDSAKVKPINIKLFGKSKQDGIPSMETPIVPVHHGESGSIEGKVLTSNIFNPQWLVDKADFTESDGVYSGMPSVVHEKFNQQSTDGFIGKNEITECVTFSFDACTEYVFDGISIDFIFEYSDGTKTTVGVDCSTDFKKYSMTSEIGKTLIGLFATYNINTRTFIKNIQLKIGEKNDYEPYTEQPFTALTPNGLRGIPLGTTIPDAIKNSPIHMNGVYWDSVEQQYYIADTKNENGKDVQRIGEYVFTGEEMFFDAIETADAITYELPHRPNCKFLFTHGIQNYTDVYWANDNYFAFAASKIGVSTLEEFQNLLREKYNSDTPCTVVYELTDPIIAEISDEEKVELDTLIMNYPNTTIVNDAGAYMEVEYVCDTQKHIEQNYVAKSELEDIKSQMAEIQQVITNL